MLNKAVFTNLTRALTNAGITPPAPPAMPTYRQLDVSPADILDAIHASEYDDPHADPEVQRLTTAHTIGKLHMDTAHHERTNAQQLREYKAQAGQIRQRLQELFAEHAEALAKHAPVIASFASIDDVNISKADQRIYNATVATQRALAEINNVLTAWHQLNSLENRDGYGNDAGRMFSFCTPNYDQWRATVGNPTLWEAARHQIPLSLAEDGNEVAKRYQAMHAGHKATLEEMERANRPSYL